MTLPKHDELDKAVYTLFVDARARNIPPSGARPFSTRACLASTISKPARSGLVASKPDMALLARGCRASRRLLMEKLHRSGFPIMPRACLSSTVRQTFIMLTRLACFTRCYLQRRSILEESVATVGRTAKRELRCCCVPTWKVQICAHPR